MAAGEEDSDELLRQVVQEALLTKAAGTSTQLYDEMVAGVQSMRLAIGSAAPDLAAAHQLAAVLRALVRCLAAMHDRKHERLLTEILDVPLWQAPLAARAAVLDFITHAVVTSAALVQSCLHTLVYSLLPPPGPAAPDPTPGHPWAPLPVQSSTQDDVLAAMERVLVLVPTASTRLLPLLTANLPHKLRDRSSHCLYLRALFRLAECPSGAGLREGILAAVVDHLINLDVEIRWEDIVEDATGEAEEEEGGLPPEEEPDIFELEGMSELEAMAGGAHPGNDAMPRGGWEGVPARPAAEAASAAPLPVDETADKLDSLMELTMGHLQRRVAAGQLHAAWDTALGSFERTILHTHRSKFTQFLLFYLAWQEPEFCSRSLLHLLLARLTDRQQPPITRSACAAYAASFLARAAYIPESLVVESLQRLADWCMRYAREEDRRGGLPPIPSGAALPSLAADAQARHAAFYAASQGLLYALAYHMEPLLGRVDGSDAAANHPAAASGHAVGRGRGAAAQQDGPPVQQQHDKDTVLAACAEAMQRLISDDMPRLLTHPLDPLSSCAHSVVAEFGRHARALGFADVFRLVREWERRAGAGGAKLSRPLEMFFPFDPYLLRRSAAPLALGQTFVRWRRGHPTGAPRADLAGGSDEDDDDDEAMSNGGEDARGKGADADSSGLDTSSSSEEGGSSDESSTSSEDTDNLRRTRFGSMPNSSLSSGGRKGRGGRGRGRLPGALQASLAHAGGSGSPTMGVPIPHGSYSTDTGSPWGMSPTNGLFGTSFVPMSCTPGR